ncbi:glycoside hydrolase family 5 protein [Oidiodendron maius Zn]|uniref:Glycoside hydrolase family 5 protein n=1 Tax=Oidiodendron maius (strain Zn) TaxID=913774 RepID=A0A0C3HL80_OIDMZ|nr:glycoside hydrolase family 5 protein [Oidiodendron maius Zn]
MRLKRLYSVLAACGLVLLWWYRFAVDSSQKPAEDPFSPRPFPPLIDTDEPLYPFHTPLRTRGRDVVDRNNQRVKLASVNWYGGSDELFIPSGLDIRHRSEIARLIRHLGFNSVRLPYSDEMVTNNPMIKADLLSANKDLIGLRALDVYIAIVESLTDDGIAVIPNNHITQATWCCGINICDTAWYNDHLGSVCRVSQTEDQWIENWVTVMSPFANNSLVIGADLRNEPRGFWGTMPWSKWATAAERVGNRLLAINPHWLMFVEGVSSSNDLSGARKRPVVLNIPDRVIYSAHVYSWSGWGSREGMYAKRPFPSFVKSMKENWAFLLEENIAPVWVGEFGGPHEPNEGDLHYWNNLLEFLKLVDADFAYWAINPRKPHHDEKEGYSLVEDDWKTPILDYRLRDMLELIRQ